MTSFLSILTEIAISAIFKRILTIPACYLKIWTMSSLRFFYVMYFKFVTRARFKSSTPKKKDDCQLVVWMNCNYFCHHSGITCATVARLRFYYQSQAKSMSEGSAWKRTIETHNLPYSNVPSLLLSFPLFPLLILCHGGQ